MEATSIIQIILVPILLAVGACLVRIAGDRLAGLDKAIERLNDKVDRVQQVAITREHLEEKIAPIREQVQKLANGVLLKIGRRLTRIEGHIRDTNPGEGNHFTNLGDGE
jgi:septal ring factor EnvC (AmiA/AmiB activator)